MSSSRAGVVFQRSLDHQAQAEPAQRFEMGSAQSWLDLLSDLLLVAVATFCTIGALTSAFDFGVYELALLPLFLPLALLVMIVTKRWRFKGLLFCLPFLLLALVLNLAEVLQGGAQVLSTITGIYSNWLPVPVLFAGVVANLEEMMSFWTAFGIALIYLLALALCLKHRPLVFVGLTLPLIILAFVIIDFPPDFRFVIGLLAVYLVLILNHALLAPQSLPNNRGWLSSLLAMVLVVALLGSSYLLAPAGSYDRSIHADFIERVKDFLFKDSNASGNGIGWPNNSDFRWSFNMHDVAISDAGNRVVTDVELLEINSTVSGVFYLRGYSLYNFDGRHWRDATSPLIIALESTREDLVQNGVAEAADSSHLEPYATSESSLTVLMIGNTFTYMEGTSDVIVSTPIGDMIVPEDAWLRSYSAEAAFLMPSRVIKAYQQLYPESAPVLETIAITPVGDFTSVNYDPYYTSYEIDTSPESFSVFDKPLTNTHVAYFYVVPNICELARTIPAGSVDSVVPEDFSDWMLTLFTEVEPATATYLCQLAAEAGIDATEDRAVISDQVAEYISTAARYTLTPALVPEGEDFVRNFLETSREGYCIHFATTATLMLRSLGVPARMAFGYVVTVPADEVGADIIVTDRQAHAWVEVYYDDVGWVPLEVTPSTPRSGIPPRTNHSSATSSLAGAGAGATSLGTDALRTHFSSIGFRNTMLMMSAYVVSGLVALLIRANHISRARTRQFGQEDTNAAVCSAWSYLIRLDSGATTPSSIESLVLKARFSQHHLSEQERACVIDYVKEAARQKQQQLSLPRRLLAKYLFGQ